LWLFAKIVVSDIELSKSARISHSEGGHDPGLLAFSGLWRRHSMKDDPRRKRRRGKAPTATEVIAEIVGQTQKEPPLLGPNWPKSDFDKLCAEHGGPADFGVTVETNDFRRCCREYPLGQVLPILRRFTDDEISARRHWPWAAFAIDQYNFEIRERAKYKDELKPREILDLLAQIEHAAHDLSSALARLQNRAFRLHEHSAPALRGHLRWLNYYISQPLAGYISNKVTDDFVAVDLQKLDFIKRLAQVEAAANVAVKRVDKALLKRRRGQSNPALRNFVRRSGEIWTRMTGRKPSTRRVERIDSDDPKFVIFVQELAKIGNAAEPSRKEIEIALRNLSATD